LLTLRKIIKQTPLKKNTSPSYKKNPLKKKSKKCAGHWTPQLIAMSGGRHPLNPSDGGTGGGAKPSRAVSNGDFAASDPDWVVVAPCGFGIERAKVELARIAGQAWWRGLRAVREGRVVVVDGNQVCVKAGV
jgi:iron complex transport system substrate-binding protein